MCRASLLSLLAAEEAMSSADGIEDHSSTLVNIGACMADLEHIGTTAEQVKKGEIRKISPYFVPRILNSLPAGYVAMKYKMLRGVESTSTACAASSLYRKRTSHSETWLCKTSAGRNASSGHWRRSQISRPFDNKRSGFVLSEGVGLLLMERLEDAQKRGANILAEVLGYGISSDAYHISSPDPSGIGAQLSMQRAIEDAKLKLENINYVNAHATSTPAGDSVEAGAIRNRFSANQHSIAVSSIKGHIGHLLGAAGSVETIATIGCIRYRKLPANLNLEQRCAYFHSYIS
ncbi:hypothetical protein WR25_16335 [Diploscapter pachys]|uniref:beta-ketoacyl-[acyl-carrier-protein] synthase I n=1 Tax=Diploscapter pachys TaxID=2018661 RepID=A0A2A2LR34_9BILA|nr:hypothetical protein WR25_16335 [Diploscapter pachys]